MKHYYYLHSETKDLIRKVMVGYDDNQNQKVFQDELEESTFVKHWWLIDDNLRGEAWAFLIDAFLLGANLGRISELRSKWQLTDEDADTFRGFAKRMRPATNIAHTKHELFTLTHNIDNFLEETQCE